MEVVKEIENVPTKADKPVDDVIIVDCGELPADDDKKDAIPASADKAPADGASMEAKEAGAD